MSEDVMKLSGNPGRNAVAMEGVGRALSREVHNRSTASVNGARGGGFLPKAVEKEELYFGKSMDAWVFVVQALRGIFEKSQTTASAMNTNIFAVLFSLCITVLSIALCSCTTPTKTATQVKRTMFYPPPLADDWSKWLVGQWEGLGESDTGKGNSIERIEFTLNGQFLICRGEATIAEIVPENVAYLKKNMHASDEEIERFKREGYQSLQLFTVDQTTGEVIGYLFDSLRCIAAGRGKREGNREVMEWQWATGHKSTRITERLSDDRMRVIQRTPMPDGSVMEEKGENVRRK